jgi:hypothetical protein
MSSGHPRHFARLIEQSESLIPEEALADIPHPQPRINTIFQYGVFATIGRWQNVIPISV